MDGWKFVLFYGSRVSASICAAADVNWDPGEHAIY